MATFMVSTWTVMALAIAAGARSSLPPDRWLPSPENQHMRYPSPDCQQK